MTELATIEPQETLPSAYNQSAQLLADVVAASKDPAVDADKITALANLAMGMQDREAERRFQMAKHNAIIEMPRITKNGAIRNREGQVQSRYSKFEDIMAIVAPILARHHLVLTFNVDHEGAMVTVQPLLSYSDGDLAHVEKGGQMVLAVDTTGSKNATQGAGSAASYGKRHAAKAMLNIIEEGEDNDGAGAKGGAYESLPRDMQALVDESRSAALGGTTAYAEWYAAQDKEQKGFLAFNRADDGKTWHEQNKAGAASLNQGES